MGAKAVHPLHLEILSLPIPAVTDSHQVVLTSTINIIILPGIGSKIEIGIVKKEQNYSDQDRNKFFSFQTIHY